MSKLTGTYFYGHEASDYAKKNGYLDYAAFEKAFNAVLNNNIMDFTNENNIGFWEQENGEIDNSDEIDNLKSQIEEIEDKMEDNDKNSNDYKTFKKEIDEMNNRINELQEQQDNLPEVFQWFIVNDAGADIIKRYTNDPLYYNNDLDIFVGCYSLWNFMGLCTYRY